MSTASKRGCGCGCGGGCSGGCNGGSVAAGVTPDGACGRGPFERPRFFGGQLLTEDDLQELVDYVVAKNRLARRALFGAGVVCGLEVNCDPCAGAKISVKPGYALDCCGNDLVVECALTLDINAMRRELRQKTLGQDCGDPCAGVQSDCGQSQAQLPVATAVDGGSTGVVVKGDEVPPLYLRLASSASGETGTTQPKCAPEHYCLYARYCESNAEPVAPYATDDCSASACQASRIREGVRFELRCRTKRTPPPTLADALKQRLGDLTTVRGELGDGAALYRTFAATAVAAERVLKKKPYEWTSEDDMALDAAQSALKKSVESKSQAPADIGAGVQSLIEVGALTARQLLAQPATGADGKPNEAALQRVLDPELLQSAAKYYAYVGEQLKDQTFSTLLVREAAKYFLDFKASPDALEFKLLGNGAFVTYSLITGARDPAGRLYDTLREHVARGSATHCGATEQAVRLPRPEYPAGKLELESALGFARTVSRTSELLYEFESSAFCEALNPPCVECTDSGVLIACLTWEDCKVTDICTLERKWVLSGPSIRYWLSDFGKLGALLERGCCGNPCGANVRGGYGRLLEQMQTAAGTPRLEAMLRLTGADAASATSDAALAVSELRLQALAADHASLVARLERLEAKGK